MKKHGQNKKVVLGLTGSFGSGKTTVAGIFHSFGAQVIDADKIARRLSARGGKIYKKIISSFGGDILKKNKALDRHKLARIVFNNIDSLKILNRIMHPEIIKIIKRKIKTSKSRVIILDAPLLIEAGLEGLVDELIVVKIDKARQIQRLLSKFPLQKAEILKRIKAQLPLREKLLMADFIIDNSSTLSDTKKQAKQIRRLLWRN